MIDFTRRVGLLLALAALAGPAAAAPYPELQWDALVPKGWDPLKRFRDLNVDALDDTDPKAAEMLRLMRETWDNAPTNPQLNGSAAKLAGYLVPLEQSRGELREFLLVPYFGACVHTPPPPANQIVHVRVTKPLKGFHSMDAVWVSGILQTQRQDSAMGMSGYRMQADLVEAYAPPKRP